MTNDGKPYGPWRYKEIVKELFIISKNCNTPYTELLKITPIERDYLRECILESAEQAKQQIEKHREQLQNN